VVEAATPPQAVEKALAGEGLLAHVVVSKYVDHQPRHRLEGIFARHGVTLAPARRCATGSVPLPRPSRPSAISCAAR
jgi:transposase